MADYLLKNIDDATYALAQARAEREGATIRYVLLRMLEHYVAHGLTVAPALRLEPPPGYAARRKPLHIDPPPGHTPLMSEHIYVVVRESGSIAKWEVAIGVGSHMTAVTTLDGHQQQARRAGLLASYTQHVVDGHDPDQWAPQLIEPAAGQSADIALARPTPDAWIAETRHAWDQLQPALDGWLDALAGAETPLLDLWQARGGGRAARRRSVAELKAALTPRVQIALQQAVEGFGFGRLDLDNQDARLAGAPVKLLLRWATTRTTRLSA